MKTMTKRVFALLTVLALCLSFLPAVEFSVQAATVDYVYAGSYIKNWGTRGTTATFLSQNAEAFYEENNTSYAELASLSGATSTGSVPSSPLFKELHELMFDNLTLWTSYSKNYDATKDQYQYTDCQNSGKSDEGKISSFYSGKLIGPSWDSGKTWNREHTWPNSKGTGASNTEALREADIMMLRPASVSENSGRGNTAYGKSSGFYNPNEQSNGTYDLRGDVARIALYVYTCWGGHSESTYHNGALDYMWGSSGVIESKEVLLEWMEADPVDTWELGRNDSVESITGTRNVFVDYPELAFTLFNEEVPADYISPSGGAAASSYTITAVSNNTAYGTVSLDGKKITATPKTGYQVSGYTVVSGSATVTREGNVFTVSPSSDCTIRIDFAARPAAVVTYVQNGRTAASVTDLYIGDTVTLPDHKGNAPEDCAFVGWVKTETAETDRKPSAIYLPGAEYNVTTASTTFYALYSYVEEGTDTGTGQWTLVTDVAQLTAGAQVVMACNTKGTVAGSLSSSVLSKVDATFSDDYTVLTLPSDAQIMTLDGSSGAWTFADENNNLLGATTVKKVAWGSGTTTWSITIDSNSAATIQNGTASNGRFLYNNSAPRFTTYTSNTTSAMLLPQLYMLDAGNSVTMYSTSIETELPTVTGISVKTLPVKTEYIVGESIDTTGLILTATYSDGISQDITEGYTVSGVDSATAGTKTVTVTYEGKTTTFSVTVRAYSVFDSNGNGYLTLTLAIGSVAPGSKLTLMQNITENVTVNKTVILDLNGNSISGEVIADEGCTLYCMDSQTDDYTVKDATGYGKLTGTVSGVQAQDGYMRITGDDGISFHRVTLQLTSMSLRAAEAGLYYKCDFAGDEMVAENVKQFGVALSIHGIPTADNITTKCKYSVFTDFKAGKQDADTTSTLLTGVMKSLNLDSTNKQNANLPIYGRAYILTKDGKLVFGAAACRTFKEQVEAIDTMWSRLSASQKTAIAAMYTKFTKVMESWNIPNLKASIA